MKKFVCPVCGYVHEGESAPEKCPVCKVPGSKFKVMDTAKLAAEHEYELRVVGIPKTIDNDLIGTDHCPGYGSAAKYIATTIAEVNRDAEIYESPLVIVVEIMGIPVLPFAIGVYLPVQLNACIMVGGLVRLAFDKMKKDEEEKKQITSDGILFCSGMIAGEGLVGILLAVFAIFGLDQVIDLSKVLNLPTAVSNIGSLVLFALIIVSLLKFSVWKKRK